MRVIVDRWVTPVMVILAAASVVFAATWTMASRFGRADQLFSGSRSALVPVDRQSTVSRTSVDGAPIGSGPPRQAPVARNGLAPIGAAGATAQGITPGSGDAVATSRQRDSGRQPARASDGDDDDDHAEGSKGERSGRGRERH